MRMTATALCLSVAEHCCAVWARSTLRKLVDTTLNETCRLTTRCIRRTATPDLYVLSGIAPPEIRRSIHCQDERTKQLTGQRHSLHHHQPVKSRLHLRNSFVSTSQPLPCKPAEVRVTKWQHQWEATQSNLKTYDIHPKEHTVVTHCRGVHGGRPTECVRDRLPPRERNICGATVKTNTVGLCAAQPHAITFRGDTEQRRHRINGGSSCAMDERRCRHNMMMIHSTTMDNTMVNAAQVMELIGQYYIILAGYPASLGRKGGRGRGGRGGEGRGGEGGSDVEGGREGGRVGREEGGEGGWVAGEGGRREGREGVRGGIEGGREGREGGREGREGGRGGREGREGEEGERGRERGEGGTDGRE